MSRLRYLGCTTKRGDRRRKGRAKHESHLFHNNVGEEEEEEEKKAMDIAPSVVGRSFGRRT